MELATFVFLVLPILYPNDTLTGFAKATKTGRAATVIGQIPDKVAMCQVKYVFCPDINEQVNPGSQIRLPNVRSILKPYCEHCSPTTVTASPGTGDQ